MRENSLLGSNSTSSANRQNMHFIRKWAVRADVAAVLDRLGQLADLLGNLLGDLGRRQLRLET